MSALGSFFLCLAIFAFGVQVGVAINERERGPRGITMTQEEYCARYCPREEGS